MAFILRPECLNTTWTDLTESTSSDTRYVPKSCYSLSGGGLSALGRDKAAILDQSPIELKDLPPNFSMSKLLSPAANSTQALILNDANPVDATHLVCLALNEQCRTSERGYLYHLPLRQKTLEGHPCDAVFVDGAWGIKSKSRWDTGNWLERLNMGTAKTMLPPGQKVIPLCLRILEYHGSAPTVLDTQGSDWSDLLTPDSDIHDLKQYSATKVKPDHYLSRTDPAVRPGIYQYSRTVEDVSTYLITYDTQWSTPFICRADAAEHDSLCSRFPTPNDVSETYVRTVYDMSDLVRREEKRSNNESAARAAKLLTQGGVRSHYGVISALIHAWTRDDAQYMVDHDRPLFGRSTLLWQELRNRLDSNGYSWKLDMLAVWPKESQAF